MRVIGMAKVSEYLNGLREGAAQAALLSWVAEAKAARWMGIADLKSAFPDVQVRGGDTIFPLAQPDQVLVAQINYGCAVLLVQKVGSLRQPNKPKPRLRDARA